jgi:hypothetical protein
VKKTEQSCASFAHLDEDAYWDFDEDVGERWPGTETAIGFLGLVREGERRTANRESKCKGDGRVRTEIRHEETI